MAWSGLGINAGQPDGTWTEFNNLANRDDITRRFATDITQFPRVRVIGQYSSSASRTAQHHWATAIKNVNPNTYILFGLSNGGTNLVYLPAIYSSYLSIMQTEAQWAQDNLMDAFQVANEFEISGQRGTLSITGITRSSNVATATTASAHGLTTGDTIIITGASDSSYNVSQVACTVTGDTTFTYTSTGSNGSATGTLLLKCGDATLIRFIKLLAVAAQAIFTRGPISYSISQGYQSFWITAGITPNTDLDLIGFNCYGENSLSTFKTDVSGMYTAFTTNLIITEFNLHSSWASTMAKGISPSQRGFDRAYADEIYTRMKYLQTLGVSQAYFFTSWWAGSAGTNNQFSLFYNTNPTASSRLIGGWKSGYDRLLERRIQRVFYGTQQAT